MEATVEIEGKIEAARQTAAKEPRCATRTCAVHVHPKNCRGSVTEEGSS